MYIMVFAGRKRTLAHFSLRPLQLYTMHLSLEVGFYDYCKTNSLSWKSFLVIDTFLLFLLGHGFCSTA